MSFFFTLMKLLEVVVPAISRRTTEHFSKFTLNFADSALILIDFIFYLTRGTKCCTSATLDYFKKRFIKLFASINGHCWQCKCSKRKW